MILPAIAAIPYCTWLGRHEFSWSSGYTDYYGGPPPWATCQWCRQRHDYLMGATQSADPSNA